jgi:hypothetical protein
MATSGNVGIVPTDVTQLIEHSARRCGVLATSLSAEQQISAKENLYFILSDLANRGISTWCQQKVVLGLALNQTTYNLPLGTVDVLDTFYRTANFIGTPASATAVTWTTDAGVGNTLGATMIGMTSATNQTLNLVVETSPDGIVWTPLFTPPPQVLTAGLTAWFDIDNTRAARFWGLRETVSGSLTLTNVQFGYNGLEITMSQLNRDDYTNFPNKSFSGRPLQFWYDKQYLVPRLWLWPVPNDITAQVVVWIQRQIQDVGSLTNTIEVPQRWLESIIFLLASRVAMELPPATLPQGRIEMLLALSEQHLLQAEASESDGSTTKMLPNISPYTR